LLGLSLAVLVATAMKDELKWAFGRPWPYAWIDFGLYRFTPFTDSNLYGAFPSGHTAYIAAPLCLMCWLAPRYKAVWLGLIGMVMLGLVAAGYHYPADVVAGFFVGWVSAAGVAVVLPMGK
jgi:membrane-associated phospholipid phosphatase